MVEPSNFERDFDFVHNEDLKITLPPTDSLNFSLEETYLSFNVRDSYLKRQATTLSTHAESVIISNDDYETKTFKVWRSPESQKVYQPHTTAEPLSTALDYYTAGHSFTEKVTFAF